MHNILRVSLYFGYLGNIFRQNMVNVKDCGWEKLNFVAPRSLFQEGHKIIKCMLHYSISSCVDQNAVYDRTSESDYNGI